MPRMRWRRTALTLALLGGVLTGCNDDGRTLAPAPSTSAAPAPSSSAPAVDASALSITVSGLTEGDLLDSAFTCDGSGIHPAVDISGIPPGTAALAVSVIDLDADGYVHWAIAGIPATTTRLEAGEVPDGTVAARTDGGVFGWEGPCPPAEDEPHRYEFSVYAAAEPIGMAEDLDGRDAIEIMAAAATEIGHATVRYGRTSEG